MENEITYSDAYGVQYICRYCSKAFSSGRALGGHQNAHRFEPKTRTRTRHGRMPRLTRVQPPIPFVTLPNPNVAANVFGPGNGFQAQSAPGFRFPMPGPAASRVAETHAEENANNSNIDLTLRL